ncbi:MAG: c-type cytochrome [Rubrivivax sp.]|nr:c-type cytochrome [Rubrivivax sp.]
MTAALAGLVLAGAAAHAQPQPVGIEACAACHGPGGNSPTPAIPSIAGQPKVFLENQLVLIREGLRDVPAMKAVMGGLNDAEIVALAQHFSAQPVVAPPGAPQADKVSAGAAVSKRALCATCHLPGYVGQSQVPRLASQHETYLAVTLKMYRDNPAPGRDTAMSAVLYGLKDADLDHLAHYFAHFGK